MSLPNHFPQGVTAIIRQLNPTISLKGAQTLEEHVRTPLVGHQTAAWLLGFAGFIAMVLASVGTYALMANSVNQRTREIGIRMALGARRANVERSVIRQGMRLAGIGIGLGLIASFVLTRALASLLFGVSPTDPITLGTILLLMVTVSITACYLPARRATQVDPIQALRYE